MVTDVPSLGLQHVETRPEKRFAVQWDGTIKHAQAIIEWYESWEENNENARRNPTRVEIFWFDTERKDAINFVSLGERMYERYWLVLEQRPAPVGDSSEKISVWTVLDPTRFRNRYQGASDASDVLPEV